MEAVLIPSSTDPVNKENTLRDQEVSPEMLKSPAIQRLLEEVRCEDFDAKCVAGKYDRTHNRHNR